LKGQAIAVTGSGINLSDFIRSVVESREDGVTNMLLNEGGAIQAHQDVSMIDFASARKDSTQEDRRTIYQLLDAPADAEGLRVALGELMDGRKAVVTLPLNVQGRRQLTGVTWVPDIRWFVVTMAHPRAVTATSHLPSTLPLLSAALLTVLLVAAFIIERTVVRRLSRLDAEARKLSEGKHDQPIGDTSADEIGRLTQTFDMMANRIASHTEDLERQVAERTATLESMAHTDFLTACLNRRGMMARLASEKSRLSRQQQNFGVLLLDVDHFKLVNDRWGHAAGDTVLAGLGGVLRENVRTYDAVARWGGEEFLIGLFGLSKDDELEAIAQKLLTATRSATFIAEGLHIQITISIGAVTASPHDDLDRILSDADKALYAAKTAGRDRIVMAG
jgi:diguanylate cyclase (GGDEF)-like protein